MQVNQIKEKDRVEFLAQFFSSIRDGTEFYQKYLSELDRPIPESLPPILREPYEITHWDPLFNTYECNVILGDDSILHLILVGKKGKVVGVRMGWYQEEKADKKILPPNMALDPPGGP